MSECNLVELDVCCQSQPKFFFLWTSRIFRVWVEGSYLVELQERIHGLCMMAQSDSVCDFHVTRLC